MNFRCSTLPLCLIQTTIDRGDPPSKSNLNWSANHAKYRNSKTFYFPDPKLFLAVAGAKKGAVKKDTSLIRP